MGKSFSKRLKKWRIVRGMLQKQAASVLGVNTRTFQGWEEGRSEPKALAMAELLRRMESHQDESYMNKRNEQVLLGAAFHNQKKK